MTLKPLTLEEYFHTIINQPRIVYVKEPTMFEKTKMFFTQQIEKINSLLAKPVAFQDTEENYEEGWAFVMRTDSYVNEDGEFIPMKETIIQGDNNGTWMESLDQLLDVFNEHYGYDVKEQVYYSVFMPMNMEGQAGYGRSLNDEVLQKILLAYPEAYDWQGHKGFKL